MQDNLLLTEDESVEEHPVCIGILASTRYYRHLDGDIRGRCVWEQNSFAETRQREEKKRKAKGER
jgi:hypothetical protein